MPHDEEDYKRFVNLLGLLFVSFGKTADVVTLEAYEMGLDDIPVDILGPSVRRAIQTLKFLPTVFELRKLAGFDVSPEGRAIIAFTELTKAVSLHGPYQSVRFGDPILNQTIIDLGGWIRVCETSDRNWYEHFRRNFISTYKENADAVRGTMYYSLGISEQANSANGLLKFTAPPIEIEVDLPRLPGLSYEPRNAPRLGLGKVAGLLETKDPNAKGPNDAP